MSVAARGVGLGQCCRDVDERLRVYAVARHVYDVFRDVLFMRTWLTCPATMHMWVSVQGSVGLLQWCGGGVRCPRTRYCGQTSGFAYGCGDTLWYGGGFELRYKDIGYALRMASRARPYVVDACPGLR